MEVRQLMQITLAKPKEFAEVVEIDKEVIGNDSRKQYLKETIEKNKCVVAKINSSIVGFLIYHTDFFDCCFISLVIVHPVERKKGYAKSMIEYFEKISPTKKVFSSTNQSNEKMKKLLLSIGYVESGYIKNLDEGDPEIIYFKQIADENFSH